MREVLRHLPTSVAVTAAVVAAPLVAVAQLGTARTAPAVALHVIAAVALSMLVARVLAALWLRYGPSSDIVFGDLLIWGWVRRAIAERRLEAVSRQLTGETSGGASYGRLLRRLSALLEARDPYTHGHSRRVARHAERIARELGLPAEAVARVRAAALVHDIGKINVPRPILHKPGKLTDAEFALVKRHAADGAAMVSALGDSELTAIVRSHHERIDGTGYPDGLAGADIPVGARIIAVADTFDAITSARPYRRSRTHKRALDVLHKEAGTQLDAAAVGAFAGYYTARRSVGWVSALVAAPQRLLTALGGASPSGVASAVPLAQTACGVGGIALVGACIAGGPLPAGSVDDQAATRSGSEHPAVVDARSTSVSDTPVAVTRTKAKSRPAHARPRARVRDDADPAVPGGRIDAAPALREPGGQSSSGGGSGSSGSGTVPPPVTSGDTTDTVTETTDILPVPIPDPEEVVEDVTSQLPQVQAPVPVPEVRLP